MNFLSHFIKKLKWKLKISSKEIKEVEYIDGAVMTINRDAFNEVNGFDEDYFFYTEEADFCFRLKLKGWKIIFNPKSVLIHERGGSTAKMGLNPKNVEMFINSKVRFCNKHLKKTEKDFFILLEKFHHFILANLFKILNSVFKGKIKFFSDKKLIFGNLFEGWKNVGK